MTFLRRTLGYRGRSARVMAGEGTGERDALLVITRPFGSVLADAPKSKHAR